jgi:NADH-quinone oxidoreductase subunit A
VIVLVTSMLALSYALGQRHQGGATGEPYESGTVSTGSARVRCMEPLDIRSRPP